MASSPSRPVRPPSWGGTTPVLLAAAAAALPLALFGAGAGGGALAASVAATGLAVVALA